MSAATKPLDGAAARDLPQGAAPARTGCEGGPPRHIGIIMDGNGRWASARGLPRALGHKAGAEAVRRTIEAAAQSGVSWLTLFAFSSENWQRPAEEVRDLTGLMRMYLRSEVGTLAREGIRLRVIGERERFGAETVQAIAAAEAATAHGTRLNLNVAVSYGGRAEILAAAKDIARRVAAGTLDAEKVDMAEFAGRLSTAGMPDPDLIIRTSGEQRLSNFLLWQAAYAEFVFQDVLWPDYDAAHLAEAIAEFCRRERRYGLRVA
ncbi:polyprenyl diphosphate synthase [Falsiroseomonas tokyonensis]|uniref:Isoprenyl transferase n=1 Tax=Falsiroseomonas tokyonensis TaxID=430521 RepID=A0ABV7BUJ8_9PROT|nr:polyprenyl diphosphate synthase [Falsiroseomonas tokyonensis]MBU8538116.1 di-trans,poly-cis-decaprenylcistransferase [Falsiroseomonas tokyonensis]